MVKAIIIGIIITIVSMVVLTTVDKNGSVFNSTADGNISSSLSDNNTASQIDLSSNGEVKVSIAGEVLYPGDYYLPANATLSDLIEAAGGLTSKADNKSFNPGLVISNHTSFYIAPGSEKESTCVETSIAKVNINIVFIIKPFSNLILTYFFKSICLYTIIIKY